MTPDEIKANLTAEQWDLYESATRSIGAADDIIGEQWGREIESKAVVEKDYMVSVKTSLEALAERNRLIKKHQWVWFDDSWCWICLECGASHNEKTDNMPHKPDCAIAAALKGIKADISWEKGVGE